MKHLAILTDRTNCNLVPDEQGMDIVFLENGIKCSVIIWDEVDWNQYKNILIRSPWDYSTKIDLFKQKISKAKVAGVNIIHSPEILYWNMDKSYLSELQAKINVVQTICVENFKSSSTYAYFSKLGPTLVFKPKVGAGGRDTFKVNINDDKDILKVLDKTSVLVQPYMASIVDEGEYSFIFFNSIFSHAVVKKAAKGEFRVQDNHGGTVSKYNPLKSELEEIQQMLNSIPYKTVYARVDVIRHKNSFYLMELEIIEPELFLRFSENGMENFAKALITKLQ